MSLQYTVAELANQFDLDYQGNGDCIIHGVAPIQSAQQGQVSFLENPKYRKYLADTQASLVVLAASQAQHCPANALISSNPQWHFAKIARLFQQLPKVTPGIHTTAVVDSTAVIPDSASIGPRCVIGPHVELGENVIIEAGTVIGANCQIGNESRLWSGVTLYYGVTLGQRVEIHSGAVIGADGFGLAHSETGWLKIPQLGGVNIADDVEIGANTTIDRGAMDDTEIGQGCKLDNQIQIGHNVKIGAHTVIAGCAAIAGSTTIGRGCLIGGGAGIVGHIKIADGVMISAMTGISKDITEPGIYCAGIQADTRRNWLKNIAVFKHLSKLADTVKKLEKQLIRTT